MMYQIFGRIADRWTTRGSGQSGQSKVVTGRGVLPDGITPVNDVRVVEED